MDVNCLLFVLTCLLAFSFTTAQNLFDCPTNWYQHATDCFHFEGDKPGNYEEARLGCSDYGAALLSVEDTFTHVFVRNWLDTNDHFVRTWYTSGLREGSLSMEDGGFVWKGTGTSLRSGVSFWNEENMDWNKTDGAIVYTLGAAGYGWAVVPPEEILPYICQVPVAEAYRIIQHIRDYDYGRSIVDLNVVERGPHFTVQPFSTVVVGNPKYATLECVADANPPATYKWFRGRHFEQQLTSDFDSRFTVTNGKLRIEGPTESKDAKQYRCEAENRLGRVISNEVRLSFGRMGEFSNVPDAAVKADAYDGASIECSKLIYKPAARFSWYKESPETFVRPKAQTYQFMSHNGKLYFSEVTSADVGNYHCLAILTGVNKHTIGTKQPPTRASLPIRLEVKERSAKKDWGPEIQDDFIAVFPQPPLVGQDVRLECFAYGSTGTPFFYEWSREGKPLPHKAVITDSNRVLTLPEATLEDQGTYTCTVKRTTHIGHTKSLHLSLGARPYFISELRDQHVDIDSQLTWRCDARANPPSTYTWYKNGEVLKSDQTQGMQVSANVLRIDKLDPQKHDGMYQCGAVNTHGMTLSEAQLRVLAFKPTFAKHPLRSKLKAAIRGNATIVCSPEGAPQPTLTWFRNGSPISSDATHFLVTTSGSLVIRNVGIQHQGRYTCKAENQFGAAESSSALTIASGTSITVGPVSTRVVVNSTAFLSCMAAHDPLLDLVYTWYFNGKYIDTKRRVDIRKTVKGPRGLNGIYIIGVNFFHTGYYECVARTTLNEDRRGAYLTVMGPPNEPTGVLIGDVLYRDQRDIDVKWSEGASNGRPVVLYTVEMANYFEPDTWKTVFRGHPSVIQMDETALMKKVINVKDLLPGNGYRFRVIATNAFGHGLPSLPSIWAHMPDAAPAIPPHHVRGGGGSVGDLTVAWTPLELYEESGRNIGYVVYWRRYGHTNSLFVRKEMKGYNDHYVTFVGRDNYFLEYEVKVQAFNDMGYGPNTSAVVIFSAEDLPMAAVTDVRGEGYNGTANLVTWTQLPATRELARGVILGYQINYWLQVNIATTWKEFIRIEGQVGEGIFLGLFSDTNYICEVRAYNSAGLGPRSETYLIESKHAPAQTYPEEVRVYSAGHGQVLVWWRGIHILQPEANVHGFVLYFWPANEHYRSACEMIIHDHHAHDAHITVDPGVIYAIRVSAWSEGGYGKKTPTMYFTLEGQVTIDAAFAKEIDVFLASATAPSVSLLLLLCALFLTIVST